MADQVNPLGSLAPSLPPSPPSAPVAAPAVSAAPAPVPAPPADGPAAAAAAGDSAASSSVSVHEAAQTVQGYFAKTPTELQFAVDKSSGRFIFKVVNPATQEVVYQMPPEQVLEMAQKLRELDHAQGARGVLVDQKG